MSHNDARDHRSRTGEVPSNQRSGGNPSILVIRLSSIGDIILTSPVLRQLRASFPDARIDFLIRKQYAPLLRDCPHVDTVLELEPENGVGELLSMRRRLSAERYDVVLDLHGNLRSFMLRNTIGANRRQHIRKRRIARFLWVRFRRGDFAGSAGHVSQRYLETGRFLGLNPDDTALELYIPGRIREDARQRWSSLRRDGFRVAMAPGARHFTKRWPADYYAELIARLYELYGWKSVLLGSHEEAGVCGEIHRLAGEGLAATLAGELTLMESFAFVECSDLFVSNDSALMHAAAALGVQQVAIFGSTTRELGFFPLNREARIVEQANLGCRPCSHIGRPACPQDHFRCMMDSRPGRVLEALRSLDLPPSNS